MSSFEFSILLFLVLFVISALAMWSDDNSIHENSHDAYMREHHV